VSVHERRYYQTLVECIPKTIRNCHNVVCFYRIGSQIQKLFDRYVPTYD